MNRIKISIQTLSPVVMSSMSNTTIMTGTHSAFSGSIIRGVLASRYVEVQKLGDTAFQDANFREIFYGGLKFLPANPEIKNSRAFVLPQSLQRAKAGTTNENHVQDLLTEENPARGYKSLRGYGIVDGDKIFTVTADKNIFMHMSRSGENERLAGKSIDGQIYNYESLDAGQNFQGEIIGDEKILRKLINGLNLEGGSLTAHVGRSRFTQYGKCRFTFEGISTPAAQIVTENFYLRLDTPLIPFDDAFISVEKVLQAEVVNVLNEICGKKFTLGKVFASGVEVENFVVTWSMKRPRVTGIAAGSVFELSAENLTDDDKTKISAKILDGFGTRTEEGFGQLRIWTPQTFSIAKLDADKIPSTEKFSKETVDLAQKILLNRILQQVRIYAQDDAEKLSLRGGNFTHFFSRLENIFMCVGKKKIRENFKKQLETEMRDGSLFENHLKNIRMANGQLMFDVLTGKAKLPHESHELEKDIPAELVKILDVKDFNFDDEFFSEYLKTYFRFARKKAAGGAANE